MRIHKVLCIFLVISLVLTFNSIALAEEPEIAETNSIETPEIIEAAEIDSIEEAELIEQEVQQEESEQIEQEAEFIEEFEQIDETITEEPEETEIVEHEATEEIIIEESETTEEIGEPEIVEVDTTTESAISTETDLEIIDEAPMLTMLNDTPVDYEEYYEIVVPATLENGEIGIVNVSGTWSSDKTITVTADEYVEVTNTKNTNESKWLKVYFDGLSVKGEDASYVSVDATISVEEASILFCTWTGVFHYQVNVAVEEPINKLTYQTITDGEYDGYTFVDCIITGGYFKDCIFEGTTSISGGLFNVAPANEYIAIGYTYLPNIDPDTSEIYQFVVQSQ